MMIFCVVVDILVLFNCFWISGILISVVEYVGDGVEWGCWEGLVGFFMVLVLLVVELLFFMVLGYYEWVG